MKFVFSPRFKEAGLCGNCLHAFITKDIDNKLMVRCSYYGETKPVPRPLKECSEHRTHTERSLRQLEEMAWVLTPGPKGKIGFKPPKQKSENSPLEDFY